MGNNCISYHSNIKDQKRELMYQSNSVLKIGMYNHQTINNIMHHDLQRSVNHQSPLHHLETDSATQVLMVRFQIKYCCCSCVSLTNKKLGDLWLLHWNCTDTVIIINLSTLQTPYMIFSNSFSDQVLRLKLRVAGIANRNVHLRPTLKLNGLIFLHGRILPRCSWTSMGSRTSCHPNTLLWFKTLRAPLISEPSNLSANLQKNGHFKSNIHLKFWFIYVWYEI